jgi:predicted PurR-regulated permease PerM
MDNFEYNLEPVRVTQTMKKNWKQIASWATFFSVIGFIGVFLQLIYLFIMTSLVTRYIQQLSEQPTQMGNQYLFYNKMFLMGLILSLIVIMVTLFFIHLYHLKFANLIQKAIRGNDQVIFERAWRNLRNHFRLYGVVLILYIVLLVFVFYITDKQLFF